MLITAGSVVKLTANARQGEIEPYSQFKENDMLGPCNDDSFVQSNKIGVIIGFINVCCVTFPLIKKAYILATPGFSPTWIYDNEIESIIISTDVS